MLSCLIFYLLTILLTRGGGLNLSIKLTLSIQIEILQHTPAVRRRREFGVLPNFEQIILQLLFLKHSCGFRVSNIVEKSCSSTHFYHHNYHFFVLPVIHRQINSIIHHYTKFYTLLGFFHSRPHFLYRIVLQQKITDIYLISSFV